MTIKLLVAIQGSGGVEIPAGTEVTLSDAVEAAHVSANKAVYTRTPKRFDAPPSSGIGVKYDPVTGGSWILAGENQFRLTATKTLFDMVGEEWPDPRRQAGLSCQIITPGTSKTVSALSGQRLDVFAANKTNSAAVVNVTNAVSNSIDQITSATDSPALRFISKAVQAPVMKVSADTSSSAIALFIEGDK